jgi:hypothetical protein
VEIVPNLRVQTGGEEALEPIDVVGSWWWSEDPDRRIGGRFQYQLDGGCTLELAGALNTPPVPEAPGEVPGHTIFGVDTAGRRITIVGATDAGGRSIDRVPVAQQWRAYRAYVGAHFEDGSATRFNACAIALESLGLWTETGLARSTGDFPQVGLEVTVPQQLSVELGDKNILLRWTETSSFQAGLAELRVQPRFVLETTHPLTDEEVWEQFTSPLMYFMTLATGAPSAVTGMDVTSGSQGADVLMSSWPAIPHENNRSGTYRWEHLLPFELIRDKFGAVIPAWLALFGSTRLPLVEFFGVMYSPSLSLEHGFLQVIRSMEVWHRLRVGGTYMDPEAFAAMLKAVRSAVTGPARELAMMRLRYGNERTARQRLDELVNTAGGAVQSLVNSYDNFSRHCIDTRNRLTHGPEVHPPGYIEPLDIFWAMNTLQAVFTGVLLESIGLGEQTNELLTRTRAWKGLASPFNSLLPPS